MKVLVTGGCGFIGSHIVEHFQGKAEVRVLDNLRTGHRRNLDGFDVELIEGSILDRELVQQAVHGVDYIFHMAAMVSVPESMSKPIECAAINVTGLLNVLEEAAAAGVKKLCFSSSAAIYGNNPTVPKIETMVPEPASPYAITKLDGEYYCGLFTREGRLPTWHACGSSMSSGRARIPASAYAAAVPIFIRKALAGEPLTVYGDGAQTRDFIYVKDIVAANVFAATTPGVTGVFNVRLRREHHNQRHRPLHYQGCGIGIPDPLRTGARGRCKTFARLRGQAARRRLPPFGQRGRGYRGDTALHANALAGSGSIKARPPDSLLINLRTPRWKPSISPY